MTQAPSVTIRAATLADEAASLDLIEELFAPPGRRPPHYTRERAREAFRRYLENPDGDVLLAVSGSVISGLATVYVDLPSIRFGLRCWLEDLVVSSSMRSGGIGRLLLDAATAWARERACTHLELDSGHGRKDAHRFYIGQGMAQDGLIFSRGLDPDP